MESDTPHPTVGPPLLEESNSNSIKSELSSTPPKNRRGDSGRKRLLKTSLSTQSFKHAFGGGGGSGSGSSGSDTSLSSSSINSSKGVAPQHIRTHHQKSKHDRNSSSPLASPMLIPVGSSKPASATATAIPRGKGTAISSSSIPPVPLISDVIDYPLSQASSIDSNSVQPLMASSYLAASSLNGTACEAAVDTSVTPNEDMEKTTTVAVSEATGSRGTHTGGGFGSGISSTISDMITSSVNAFGISRESSSSSSGPLADLRESPPPPPDTPIMFNDDINADDDADSTNGEGSQYARSLTADDASSRFPIVRPTKSSNSHYYNKHASHKHNKHNNHTHHIKGKSSGDSMATTYMEPYKRVDSLQHMWDALEPNLKAAMKDYKTLEIENPVQWISSSTSEWVLGTGSIDSEAGSLSLKLEDEQVLFVPDLRKTTVVGSPRKRYMEIIIPPGVGYSFTRIILAPTSETDFIHWLSCLLLFSNLRPAGLQQKVLIVPREVTVGSKESVLVGHFEVLFPFYKNKPRRASGVAAFAPKAAKAGERLVSPFSKDGQWQPVLGILYKSGVLKLMHESDGSSIQTIDLTKILASRVRQIDYSVFESKRVLYVLCQDAVVETSFESPTKSKESHLFFCRFDKNDGYYDWFTALRSFSMHRIFSAKPAAMGTLPTINPPPSPQEYSLSPKTSLSSSSQRSTPSPASTPRQPQQLPLSSLDLSKSMRVCRRISLRIIEGKVKEGPDQVVRPGFELSPFHDTYVEVQFENIVWARTFVLQGNAVPFWREDFTFEDFPVVGPTVKLVLKRRLAAAVTPALDPVIGSVIIEEKRMRECQDVEKWFPIQFSPEAQREYEDLELYLCLRISYEETKVLPAEQYSYLESLLSDLNNGLTVQISDSTNDINHLSDVFLKIMLTDCQALRWLISLIDFEISKLYESVKMQESSDLSSSSGNLPDFRKNVTNTLFRGNSLLTKALERYMKLTGTEYLDKVVGVFTRKVVQNAVFLEIDPDRLAQMKYPPDVIPDMVKENQDKLDQYTKYLWTLIKNSIGDMPPVFKLIFKRLRIQLAVNLKREDYLVYNSVSGFLFLRFFCPAILNPKLFGLTRAHPAGNVQRSLTLITKMLQGFANRVRFGFKEPWMIPMNSFLDTHENELLDFYKAVTLSHEDSGVDDFAEEVCLLKHVSDGSLQNAIGCSLSNPYLIDKYENYAKLVEIWSAGAGRVITTAVADDVVTTAKTAKSDVVTSMENSSTNVSSTTDSITGDADNMGTEDATNTDDNNTTTASAEDASVDASAGTTESSSVIQDTAATTATANSRDELISLPIEALSLDSYDTPVSSSFPIRSRPSRNNGILRKFAEECERITQYRDNIYQLLENADVVTSDNEDELAESTFMKFDISSGKVTLASTMIASSSPGSSKRRDKKHRYRTPDVVAAAKGSSSSAEASPASTPVVETPSPSPAPTSESSIDQQMLSTSEISKKSSRWTRFTGMKGRSK